MQPRPAKALALHHCASFIYRRDMENCLCQINTYSINIKKHATACAVLYMVRSVLLKETLILAYEAARIKRGGPFHQMPRKCIKCFTSSTATLSDGTAIMKKSVMRVNWTCIKN